MPGQVVAHKLDVTDVLHQGLQQPRKAQAQARSAKWLVGRDATWIGGVIPSRCEGLSNAHRDFKQGLGIQSRGARSAAKHPGRGKAPRSKGIVPL